MAVAMVVIAITMFVAGFLFCAGLGSGLIVGYIETRYTPQQLSVDEDNLEEWNDIKRVLCHVIGYHIGYRIGMRIVD